MSAWVNPLPLSNGNSISTNCEGTVQVGGVCGVVYSSKYYVACRMYILTCSGHCTIDYKNMRFLHKLKCLFSPTVLLPDGQTRRQHLLRPESGHQDVHWEVLIYCNLHITSHNTHTDSQTVWTRHVLWSECVVLCGGRCAFILLVDDGWCAFFWWVE